MFYYLNGTLVLRDASTAVLDCSGVGYRLTVSANTSESIAPRMGMQTKLLTYLQVREDGMELFGFSSQEELDIFKLLIGVSGVGPKAAMSILSVMTPDRVRLAVCTEDTRALAKAPNIGNKTAARIVLELKDKVASDILDGTSLSTSTPATAPQNKGKLGDALEALMALGYDRSTAMNALRGIDTDKLSVNDIIAQALKKFL